MVESLKGELVSSLSIVNSNERVYLFCAPSNNYEKET